ncbi:hypothetical protein NPIL_369331, partial [Nephila pilipes]
GFITQILEAIPLLPIVMDELTYIVGDKLMSIVDELETRILEAISLLPSFVPASWIDLLPEYQKDLISVRSRNGRNTSRFIDLRWKAVPATFG